jgi:hypothetical protein
METDRLSYLLRHEATAHGKEDYKHLAADALESLSAEVECLRAELAACQQDAERYRWVLEHWDTGGPDFGKIMFSSTAETLSADIDTARKGEGE